MLDLLFQAIMQDNGGDIGVVSKAINKFSTLLQMLLELSVNKKFMNRA
jgi:hypothetical protein